MCGSGCNRAPSPSSGAPAATGVRPSILLVTLDTTRADAIGPEATGVETPAFNAIAARGRRFRQAYATVPETLPSHSSIMTGLYPAGHGVHENARYLAANVPVLAERLRQAGYRTSAFVSSFVLIRRFGLARGFDVYDDALGATNERSSRETTDAALAELGRGSHNPRFLWVHYYDAHYPYAPPEPYRSRYAKSPYLGEVAAMDEQLGRLSQAFERQASGPIALAIVADHGEGLGDHGEAQHGDLLYQSTMHVPLVIAGPGVEAGVSDAPVSTRRIFHTLLDWAGLDASHSLRPPDAGAAEVVLGEAMKPFLEYGWQPQIMAVSGRVKAILAGTIETYDIVADPGETRNLGNGVELPSGLRQALEEYPVPSPDVARAPANLDEDAKRRLASLGYVGATAAPVVRKDAPRPAAMTPLLGTLDKASARFAAAQYAQAIPLLEEVLAADPYNLDAALRLATAHSSLGHERQAEEMFRRAAAIAPKSQDVRTYLALHYARTRDWVRAVPLLEQVVAESPDRLTAVEALASLQVRQGRQAMDAGQTGAAIAALERARALQPAAFRNDLELGVLYLAARRFADARTALDRALAAKPDDPMALFKRAQVSVLLNESDRLERIETARRMADATTRPLIAREQLFQK
ncbi:MAG TPA: sulfatase-like hydrolase/transferase [Vicinamibacterales bacterium]